MAVRTRLFLSDTLLQGFAAPPVQNPGRRLTFLIRFRRDSHHLCKIPAGRLRYCAERYSSMAWAATFPSPTAFVIW